MHTTEDIVRDHEAFQYPINASEIPAIEADILDMTKKATNKRVANAVTWPGLPVGHVPLRHRTIVQNMVERGTITIVSRPRTTDPSKLAHFYKIA